MAWAVEESKTQGLEEFGEAMETYFESASKRFCQTVRHLREGKPCFANTVYSGNTVLLTITGDTIQWWKEYFEDLLNPSDMLSTAEAKAEEL